jgi:tetratricopeptide (TPR) repeat protein
VSQEAIGPRCGGGRLFVLLGTLVALAAAGVYVWGDSVRAAYHLRAARTSLRQLDYAGAESHLLLHLQLRPASAEGHLYLGRLLRRRGRVSEAQEHLRRCVALGGERDAVEVEKVLLQVQEGNFTSAMEHFLRARLGGQPDDFLVLEAFSQGFTKTYRLRDALDCLDQMLARQPQNVFALVRRGWVLEHLGKLDAAEDDYRRAVALEPRHPLARQRLAELLFAHRKNTAEAAEHFAALRQLSPDDTTAAVNLTRCWLDQGRADEARRLLDDLLAAHPREPVLLIERGKLALSEGQVAAAERWLREAMALQPTAPGPYYSLFLCLNAQGRTVEAQSFRTRFDELQADVTRLEALLRRAAEAQRDPSLCREIARLFSSMGEQQEAERWLLLAQKAGAGD